MTALTRIHYVKSERRLELDFDDDTSAELSAEFLRVHSPSAEVKGHGPGQEVLQIGKRTVEITAINPVGHYAVQLVFSDGHDSGIYSWSYLRDLSENNAALWQNYLSRLNAAGASRDPDTEVIHFIP